MYRSILKPVIDFLAALTVLLVLSPVILVTIVLLFIANDGKPFFTHAAGREKRAYFPYRQVQNNE